MDHKVTPLLSPNGLTEERDDDRKTSTLVVTGNVETFTTVKIPTL